MDAATEVNSGRRSLKRLLSSPSNVLSPKRRKKITVFSTSWRAESEQRYQPYPVNLLKELETGKYGSVDEDIKALVKRRQELADLFYAMDPELLHSRPVVHESTSNKTEATSSKVIVLEDEHDESNFEFKRTALAVQPVVIIDSDDESDTKAQKFACIYGEVTPKKPSGNLSIKDFLNFTQHQNSVKKVARNASETESMKDKGEDVESIKDKGEYVGTEDDTSMEESGEASETNLDGLDEIWSQMNVALECSKDASEDALLNEYENEEEEDCEHSFVLKDDIGDVCRICGVIGRRIESIIEYNISKATKSARTYYRNEGRASRELNETELVLNGFKSSTEFTGADINPHPRHRKEMKPHQVEGFNFLLRNLVSDNPGGCIMAHAPGSGKTFMIISFLQSFMAKYPAARPLVVLPKGILGIWKKEFLRWQVEDIPLYDFYSVKAESRSQQLQVLKAWEKERSILFLGYQQFSKIICDTDGGQVAAACQHYLLKIPSILILDEGHTPRNQDTDILTSLERIETTRKVVLSGTLYQNHVKEVFNILNLVRPRFIKSDSSKAIKRRILSRVEISGRRDVVKHGKEKDFYELIELTLTKDENHTRKVTVIQDLREMTKHVLHYYRGDNLDELPGLVDFSVILRLHPKQKAEVNGLKTLNRKFTISAQGSALYVHPRLRTLSKGNGVRDRVDEEKIDEILEKIDFREGVKGNFYLNLLRFCESSGEKLLVFSQYLLPLKFLERMTAKLYGYTIGREMFMITGDSDTENRESSVEKFNNSSEARVFFGSIRACGEGISLVGASRILVLDVPLNPSVTRQGIGRAFRPGQVRKVYTYRLIAGGSPEEDDHITCFRKESIAKLWFEWDHSSSHQKLEMDEVDKNNCGDMFLETARVNEDVVSLSKR